MKKLFLLLALLSFVFTACEGGLDNEENGGNPSNPKIELSQQSVEVDFESAQHSISITSPCSWEATAKNDWIEVITENGIAGTKELKFSVERNEELEIREGTIVIKNDDYNLIAELYVTQGAFVPEWSVSPETLTFAVDGGTKEIAITANFEYAYSSNADWLTIKKSEKGILVTVPNYVEVDERTAEITISNEKYGISKVVKATQGAFVPEWTIEPESLTFTVEGGTQEVAITANFEYEASANADWLTVEKSEKGVKITAATHIETTERTADITISNEKYGISKVVKATQGAFVPEWTIEPESLTFTVEGGTQEVAITANFEYEASANADWLTVEKSEKGVKITAVTHIETTERTADITISNEKYGISKVVKATQRAFVPAITIEPESLAFAVEGGTQEIAITANFEYEVSANADWLTIEKSDKGVNISATPNTKFKECTAEITISNKRYNISKTISVVQKGVSAEPQNVIIYTSSDGKIVTPHKSNVFGANIVVSNIYSNVHGQGIIIFDAPVTSIGDEAFENCTSLTSVTIPNSVTTIGDHAFYYCKALTSVTIPDSVTWIGDYAFVYCSSLTSVTIPDSVTSIGDYAFEGCSSLASVTIPNRVTSIGDYAFEYCRSLTSITIPDSVTEIGGSAFYNCTSLTSATIGNSVTSIGVSAFRDCTSLTSVTIGNSVTSIGHYAFEYCRSLTSITIPDSVTSIGEMAFRDCI